MAKRIIKLTFPKDLIKEPLTFTMATKYNIMPNIRRAKVTESVGGAGSGVRRPGAGFG